MSNLEDESTNVFAFLSQLVNLLWKVCVKAFLSFHNVIKESRIGIWTSERIKFRQSCPQADRNLGPQEDGPSASDIMGTFSVEIPNFASSLNFRASYLPKP